MNKVYETGRLTRDPELHYTNSGIAVCNFHIAVDREYKSEDPNAPKAIFVPVVAWRNLAEIVANNLKKGRKILVEGKLEVSTYNAEDGSRRYVTNIVADKIEFMDYPKKTPEGNPSGIDAGVGTDPPANIPDEEVPF